MNTPIPRTVTVVEAEQYDEGFPSANLLSFNAWLQSHLASIPPEYRGGAEICFGYREDYGDSIYVTVCISYERPETPEEVAKRVASSRHAIAEKERQEKLLYSQLKVKYESPEEPNVT